MKYLLYFLFALIALSSCKKDRVHTSILGTWNCDEFSEYGESKYQVSIMRNSYLPSDSTAYIIINFHNMGIDENNEVYVSEDEPGILTITGTANTGVLITGTGDVASDFSKIEWNYQVNDGGNNPTVSATYY